MKAMRRVVLVIASLLMLASTAYAGLGCSEDDEAEVTWRLATFSTPGDTHTLIMERFVDNVNEMSDGRMEIKMFTSGSLYSGEDIFDAVSSGNIQLGHFGMLSDKFSRHSAVTAQQWGDTIEEQLLIQQAVFSECDLLVEESEANNIMTLLMISAGEMGWMFDRPVEVKEDVAGLQIWSTGAVGNPIIEAFGATPVVLDITNIYLAADHGTIDGLSFMNVDIYYKQSLYEVVPYLVRGGAMRGGTPMLMNIDAFEALPADLQDIVQDAALEAQDWGFNAVKTDTSSQIAALEAEGVDIYELPEAEAARWLDETIYPILQGALYMVFTTEDEIAQVMAAAEAAEAELAAGS